MKFHDLLKRTGAKLVLVLGLSISGAFLGASAYAQLPDILRLPRRAPNPKTKPSATPRPTPRPTAVNNTPRPAPARPAPPAPRPKGPTRPSADDRIESELDNANEDRDARRFEKAEKRYLTILKARPREWRAAYGLGNVYADQQLWEKAEKFYAQAIDRNPKDAEIFIALGYVLLQPRARGNDANLLLKAEQAARRALLLESKNAAANDLLGLALEQRGILSDEAEQAFRKAIEQEPGLAATYVHLARFLTKKKRDDDAGPLYNKAFALAREQDADTAILVASELQWEQRWNDSLSLLEYALGNEPGNPAALMLQGRAFAATGKLEEAATALQGAIKKIRSTFMPHYLLGTVYLRLGRIGEAEGEFNEAAKVASEAEKTSLAGAYGFEGVGDAYTGAGLHANALRVYQRAVNYAPDEKRLQDKAEEARKKAGR
jgi:tetratricopeptide (TPR) repeat protein